MDQTDSSSEQALLSVDDVMKWLNVSRNKLYKMAREGDIPAFRIGTTWRFNRDRITSWLEAKANESGGGRQRSDIFDLK